MAALPEGMIYVVSTRNDGHVVLSEMDDRHPGGNAFIANSEGVDGEVERVPVLVFRTPAVQQRIVQTAAAEVPQEEAEAVLSARRELVAGQNAAAVADAMAQQRLAADMQNVQRHLLGLTQELRDTQAQLREAQAAAVARVEADRAKAPNPETLGAETIEDRLARGDEEVERAPGDPAELERSEIRADGNTNEGTTGADGDPMAVRAAAGQRARDAAAARRAAAANKPPEA
jgi:hypothetical protein